MCTNLVWCDLAELLRPYLRFAMSSNSCRNRCARATPPRGLRETHSRHRVEGFHAPPLRSVRHPSQSLPEQWVTLTTAALEPAPPLMKIEPLAEGCPLDISLKYLHSSVIENLEFAMSRYLSIVRNPNCAGSLGAGSEPRRTEPANGRRRNGRRRESRSMSCGGWFFVRRDGDGRSIQV
jgi:hypothetical protein